MSGPSPVFVPVRLDALVVNDAVRIGMNFQRWQANFALLRHRLSPEPPPFGGIDTEFATSDDRCGVYVHWQLPAALTRGHLDRPDDAAVDFPLVPNRWLVVRTAAQEGAVERTRTAWVVEGDHLDPEHGTSPYATPDGRITRIGRRIALADGEWSEPGPPDGGLFLTAVGPGLPTFAAYQPYCADVFSVHDTLEDLAGNGPYTVSYLVAGWYSDTSGDPLAGLSGERLRALLDEFGWRLTDDEEDDTQELPNPATRMVCHGTVLGLAWDRGGEIPISPRPDIVNAALGNTSAHATSALFEEATDAAPGTAQAAALLATVQARVLDDLDDPDGQFTAARRTFASWFVPTPSGHTWTLEEAPADPESPQPSRATRRARRREPAGLLDELNAHQAAHDAAAQDLAAARRRLYDLWWADGMPVLPDLAPGQTQPDPDAYHDRLTARLAEAVADVERREVELEAARSLVPWGATAEELEKDVAHRFGEDIEGFVLKRAALPGLHRSNEPMVLLRGTKADQAARLTDAGSGPGGLRCRRPGELVTGVYLDAERTRLVAALGSAVPPVPHLPQQPDELTQLLTELFHLDPAGAGELAAAAGLDSGEVAALRTAMSDPAGRAQGTPPALGIGQWQQPWSPLFFQWEIDYYPIAFCPDGQEDDPQAAHWSFDGDRYTWTGQGGGAEPLVLRGRQFLTPTPAQGAAGALAHYAHDHPGPQAAALRRLSELAAKADLVAQSLDGFQEQLYGRSLNMAVPGEESSRSVRAAAAEQTAELRPPQFGSLPRPFVLWPPSRFQYVRCGQFAFQRLSVVDRFGRALPVVIPDEYALRNATGPSDETAVRDTIGVGTPAHAFRPRLADELRPATGADGQPITVVTQDRGRFAELKPRLPQPARTRLDAVRAADDTPSLVGHERDALCGWLIPNYLDRALLCYGPDGAPLGTLATRMTTGGEPSATWLPLPGSPYALPDDLAADHPHPHGFVTALLAHPQGTLRTLLRAVDRSLTTIAPTGDRPPGAGAGALLGRPLALVRTRVRIDLDGPAHYDPAWENLLDTEPSALATHRWPVRLGERDELGDGLLAYVHEQDYRTLHTVLDADDLADLEDPGGYLSPIGTGTGLALPARPPHEHTPDSTTRLTLLTDPYGTVHATTGILPTAALRLPPGAFEEPLAALTAAFRFGPMPVLPIRADGDTRSSAPELALPVPSRRHGVWTWEQATTSGGWRSHATRSASAAPDLPAPRPELRTGWLLLHPAAPEEDA